MMEGMGGGLLRRPRPDSGCRASKTRRRGRKITDGEVFERIYKVIKTTLLL